MSHVFISYSTQDITYASRLAEKLRAEGFDVWIDNRRLRSSEDWWRSIVLAIDACAAFVVLLTPRSDQSKWVQREITLADQRNKPIFPLLLAGDIDTPNWALFVRTQYEDVRDGHLPNPGFFANLAENVPRRRGQKGANVVRMAQPRTPTYDPALQTAIDMPPPVETKPARRSLGWLVFLIALIAVVATGAIVLNDTGALDNILGQVMPGPVPDDEMSAEQHFAKGAEAVDRQDYGAAIEQFSQALEAGYEPAAEALTARGDVRREIGDLPAAIGDYQAAIEANPDFAEAYYGLGEAYANSSQFDQAIESYNMAYERGHNTWVAAEALKSMAWIFHDRGDYPAAIDHFQWALEASRDPSATIEIRAALGDIYMQTRNFPAAVEQFQQLAALNPDEPDVFRKLGEAFEQAGDIPPALENYHHFVAMSEQQGKPVGEDFIQHIGDLEREIGG